MEGEEFCGLGVPSGKCICWDKIRCCIYDLKTSRNNTLLGSGVWRGSLKWYPRVDGSVVLSTSTFYRLTFHVLWLISPKDLSEEEQREHKFSLTGKIIKLNVSTGYSRSSHEIDRNIRVIGTHRGDEVMKDNPLFLEVVHVMVLDVIIFNLRFSNLWNSWKYVKLYKDVLVWEFYRLSSDRLSLSGHLSQMTLPRGLCSQKNSDPLWVIRATGLQWRDPSPYWLTASHSASSLEGYMW